MLKRRTVLLVVCVAALCLSAAPAMAAMFGDGGAALQGVLNGITIPPPSSVDVTTDELPDTLAGGTPYDSYWSVTATGGSVSTIIAELAAFMNTNTFGIYDAANPANKVQVFAGAATAGSQAAVTIKADGSVFLNIFNDTGVDFAGNLFGYYLDATVGNNNPNAVFYSDSSLNADGGFDHMYAYQGKNIDTVQLPNLSPGLWTDNEYVLAFEDLWAGGDKDYTDFVVMVESVVPVPVPAAVLLGMLGLSVAGFGMRRFA